MTNDCKTCPVSTGTHKPAEAVHQIDDPQADALRLAAICESKSIFPVADELRRQHARIAELESQLEAIGAGGVESLRKGFVRLTDVLARLEQGFGANSAPVTTIKRHFEMQAAPAHPAEGVPSEKITPDEWRQVVHDFWIKNSRNPLIDDAEFLNAVGDMAVRKYSATQPAAQGMELANCKGGKWLTVVYRDIQPGDEARIIGEHPKVSALSWSHALNDRDAALAAQAKQGEQP